MTDTGVVIVSAVRSPIGAFCGGLSSMKSHDLGGLVIADALERASIKPEEVSEVIFGQGLLAGEGQNPARVAAVKGGIPHSVPAYVINMLCGSGLKAIVSGCQSIRVGDAEIVVCGGQENMSQTPHTAHLRLGVKMGNTQLVDSLIADGLTDAFFNIHMGETGENLAKKYNITREEQDMYAAESQRRAEVAQKEGFFQKEILPVSVPNKSGDVIVLEDEHPRHGTTVESLAHLRPVFVKNGTVTAGNASGCNDGAAAVVLMSLSTAKARGLTPLATIVAYAQTGVDPDIMGIGPVSAVQAVLLKAGWTKEDVDLYELNEAFASQTLAVLKELQIDQNKVNIHGGAIALGHPIGCSGARILVTLLYALEKTGGKKGVAALCIGGGMGIAMAIQRN